MRSLKSAISNQQSAIDFLLGLIFFALYLFTLIPSVLPADNGEFQLVAWKLGIAHPPGYPLYTMMGWLFSRFFASPAFALNLLSAVLAAITLVVVSRTVRMLTGSIVAGILAASLLGVSTTFWAQATTANIRMPTAFFTALCVSLLVAWSRSVSMLKANEDPPLQPPDSHAQRAGAKPRQQNPSFTLSAFAFVFALGLSHHLSLLFPGVFFLLYIFLVDLKLLKQPRRWLKPIGFFALGLLPLLYLPLRGATGGTFANGEPAAFLAQPAQFFDYVSGRGFEGDFFYFINTRPNLFLDRVKLLPTLFDFQFNWLAFVLFLVGAVRVIWKDWKLAVMLLGGIALHTFVTLAYRAPQTVEYLIPTYVLLAIVIGYGLKPLGRTSHAAVRSLPVGRFTFYALRFTCILAITLLFINHFPSFNWLHQKEDTRAYAEDLLNAAPPNAIILSNWHWANPLWYLQQVEGQRTDVEVQYVFPRGEELAQSWLNAIDAGLKAKRPVVVNMFFHDQFNASPYFFIPLSTDTYEVRAAPLTDRPVSFTTGDINFADKFRVVGYQLLTPSAPAGEPLTLLVAYRVESAPDPTTSFFVHLVNPEGSVIGQADQTVQAGRYQVGDVFIERFHVAPLIDVQPGEYQLLTGARTIGLLKADGNERVPIATARVTSPDRLIDPPGIDLSNGIVYLNSSAVSGEVKPGDEVKINLNFTAARPLLRDTIVSVQMTGNGWRVTDDFVPALGAIPTLKWIAGSQVLDPHTLKIPDTAAPGPAQLSVILYDAFTQDPLALLDAELIKQGQAIPIGSVSVTR